MNFVINGKKLKAKDSWEALTFSEYMRILKTNDMVEIFSVVTGIDYELLKNADVKGFDKLLYCTRFVKTVPDIPLPVKVGKYKLPLTNGKFDVQFESLAQFEDMRKVMAAIKPDSIEELTASYPEFVAIYLQKLRDGKYDGNKATEMVEEVKQMPGLEVISVGTFFLTKLTTLLIGTPPNCQNTKKSRTKSTGKSSRKSSGRTPR